MWSKRARECCFFAISRFMASPATKRMHETRFAELEAACAPAPGKTTVFWRSARQWAFAAIGALVGSCVPSLAGGAGALELALMSVVAAVTAVMEVDVDSHRLRANASSAVVDARRTGASVVWLLPVWVTDVWGLFEIYRGALRH